jgi:hypothetical protein
MLIVYIVHYCGAAGKGDFQSARCPKFECSADLRVGKRCPKAGATSNIRTRPSVSVPPL